jgi:hypothetical protein
MRLPPADAQLVVLLAALLAFAFVLIWRPVGFAAVHRIQISTNANASNAASRTTS